MARLFRDDTGPVLPVLCHAGDLFSRYARGQVAVVRALLAAIAGAGYHGVRTWTVLHGDYWRGREVGPQATTHYWALVADFARELDAAGLGWLVSQGDALRVVTTTAEREAFARRLVETLPRDVVLGVDCGNEVWQNGEPDPSRLVPMARVFAAAWPDVALSLSSPPGEERTELDAWSLDPATVFDVHGYRGGRWWDKVRHIFSVAYEVKPARRLGVQSEPFGPGAFVSASQNKHELVTGVMQAAAVQSLMTRQAWVYFSGPGVMSDAGEDLRAMPGFAETPAAGALLPRDVMTGRLIHGGTTWAQERVFAAHDETRCDHALLPDGRFACLIYGPSWASVAEAVPERPCAIASDTAFGVSARLVVGRLG